MALPVTEAVGAVGAVGAAGTVEPTDAGGPVSVLLVDDQPANLVALEAMLQGLGQRLVTASSGREALKRLLDEDFAVILLDVKMPEMDGFETAALIRERERSRNTPIIFLTAADRTQTYAVRGYAVGAVDYLIKPIVPEFVRSKVSVFVELAKKNEELVRQAERLRASEQAARELLEAQGELVRDLEVKNRELESFSYAVSHDLRAPLRRIDSFGSALEESHAGGLDATGLRFVANMREAAQQMAQLIDDVLHLARVTRAELRQHDVDLSAIATLSVERHREAEPGRQVTARIRPGVTASGDGPLLRIALENLIDNAWKFTGSRVSAEIEFGSAQTGGETAYFVRDDGAGFDMTHAGKLFGPFQRLHLASEYPGSGIGLATVQRIVHRHGGRVWAEARPGEGATFWFTVGRVRERGTAGRRDGGTVGRRGGGTSG
jgi:two-component system sensor histidine kinase/response regulator